MPIEKSNSRKDAAASSIRHAHVSHGCARRMMPKLAPTAARFSLRALNHPARHWLPAVNAALAAFLAGGFAAPVFAAIGLRSAADSLYSTYHLTCHQWAFRSFFLFGSQ